MARLVYFCLQALKHVGRSPIVAAVTVATVAVVFLLVTAAALLAHNLTRLTERLEAGLSVVAYLRDEASPGEVAGLAARLEGLPQTASVRHVTREAALADFRARLGAQAELLEALGDNPLPASLEVELRPEARHPEGVRALAAAARGQPGVEEVQYGEAWLDSFHEALEVLGLVGWALAGLVLFAALLIVSNTVRLSVFARQEEIHILKLVGATDRFVKVPFYLEGAGLGALGAGLGVGLGWVAFEGLVRGLGLPMGPGAEPFLLTFPGPALSWGLVGTGVLVGLVGTFASLWRHLRI
jgi:cell division transport system permease protein